MGRCKQAFVGEMIFLAGREGIELEDLEAKEIGQVMRKAGVGRDVMLVDQACVARGNQGASILHIQFQQIRFAPASKCNDGATTILYFDKSSVGRAKSTAMLRSCSAL